MFLRHFLKKLPFQRCFGYFLSPFEATTVCQTAFGQMAECLNDASNKGSQNPQHYAIQLLFIVLLNVIMQSVDNLNVIMLNVVMLNAIMLNVAFICCCAECHYAECHYSECQ